MRYLASLALVLGLLTGSASAVDYYFSDCGVGYVSGPPGEGYIDINCHGAPRSCSWLAACDHGTSFNPACITPGMRGSQGNPYCLDPGNDGIFNSFEQMMDGGTGTLTTELAAGDTVYLCAGACDAQSVARWPLDGHTCYNAAANCSSVTTCVFDTEAAGTITIRPYCSGNNCERVILSGDSNGDNAYTSGEPAHFMTNNDCDAGVNHGNNSYTILGNPNGDGVSDLVIEKFQNHAFYLARGASGWTIDGVEIRYFGNPTYVCTGEDCDNIVNDGIGLAGLNCKAWNDTGGATELIALDRETGTVNLLGLKSHHACGFVQRLNNNCQTAGGIGTQQDGCTDGPVAINVEDNISWNTGAFANYHQAKNVNFRRNYIYDSEYGIQSEEQTSDILVEDNTVACLGLYNSSSKGSDTSCKNGIAFTNGDRPPEFGGKDGCGPDCGYFCRSNGIANNGTSQPCCTGPRTGPSCTPSDIEGRCFGESQSWTPCFSHDNIIRRNTVYGTGKSSNEPGYMMAGIFFEGFDSTGGGATVIENNMIYRIQKSNSCNLGAEDNRSETALSVRSNSPVIVRNNTILDTNCPVLLANASHVFTNNIVMRARLEKQSWDQHELYIFNSAAGSTVTNNLFSPVDGDGSIAPICVMSPGLLAETFSSVCSGGITKACAAPIVYQTGNVCGTSKTFSSCAWPQVCWTTPPSPPATAASWDLHLSPGDRYAQNAGDDTAGRCAADDIDLDLRGIDVCDIGADEAYIHTLGPNGPEPPPAYVAPPPYNPATGVLD